jgi:DNA-binding response OmpR family regulator
VKKVLIVDDQFAAARLLAALLKLDGYDPHQVTDWRNLVHEIEAFRPDLVILDVHLPDVDGFELLENVRTHPDAGVSRVPVLLISALDYGHKTFRSGASGFLLKPFTHQSLIEAIRKIDDDLASQA